MSTDQDALLDAFNQPRFYRRLRVLDGCWALLLIAVACYIGVRHGASLEWL